MPRMGQIGQRLQQIRAVQARAWQRTLVYTSNRFERGEQQHEDNSHAEHLDTSARHVEHEHLHWK